MIYIALNFSDAGKNIIKFNPPASSSYKFEKQPNFALKATDALKKSYWLARRYILATSI